MKERLCAVSLSVGITCSGGPKSAWPTFRFFTRVTSGRNAILESAVCAFPPLPRPTSDNWTLIPWMPECAATLNRRDTASSVPALTRGSGRPADSRAFKVSGLSRSSDGVAKGSSTRNKPGTSPHGMMAGPSRNPSLADASKGAETSVKFREISTERGCNDPAHPAHVSKWYATLHGQPAEQLAAEPEQKCTTVPRGRSLKIRSGPRPASQSQHDASARPPSAVPPCVALAMR